MNKNKQNKKCMYNNNTMHRRHNTLAHIMFQYVEPGTVGTTKKLTLNKPGTGCHRLKMKRC